MPVVVGNSSSGISGRTYFMGHCDGGVPGGGGDSGISLDYAIQW